MRYLRQLGSDERGVGTVEFALMLPVLVLVFVGGNFLAETVIVQNKVARAANALARLASIDTTIDDARWNSYRAMTATMLEPMDGTPTVVLSSVGNAGDSLQVRWSASTGTALVRGAPFAFPAGATAYASTDKNVLVAKVTLPHSSLLARIWNALPWAPFTFTQDQTYSDLAYALPLTKSGAGTDLWTRRSTGGTTVF